MNSSYGRPVSDIIRSKREEEDDVVSGKLQSREEWRKSKELEEARKAGTAPAAVDEEGKDINPHIPQYIMSAPWYFGSQRPTLKHQKLEQQKRNRTAGVHDFFETGLLTEGPRATKYRKDSCENCGSMTHKRKDCLERPRKILAKYSNEKIAPDEKIVPSTDDRDFDAKRDRWAGFDPAVYNKMVFQEFDKIEEAKRILKEQRIEHQDASCKDTEDPPKATASDDSSDEDEKYADKIDMPGTKMDTKQRITVRNLRIREDTAKYLRNLDPDSAYYDPKTRSMRDDPYKNSKKTVTDVYAGENFVRYSGDTMKVMDAQKFAWNASDKGVDVHMNAEPTKAELIHKEFKEKAGEITGSVKGSIVEKYGGLEYLQTPPKELILSQTEDYTEYSRSGKLIKGAQRTSVKSRYEEDIFRNNHSSVWGSYWEDGRWGFKCCHSFIKNSYCTRSSQENLFKSP
jgi:pre-mRNA-processing factor SLU7